MAPILGLNLCFWRSQFWPPNSIEACFRTACLVFGCEKKRLQHTTAENMVGAFPYPNITRHDCQHGQCIVATHGLSLAFVTRYDSTIISLSLYLQMMGSIHQTEGSDLFVLKNFCKGREFHRWIKEDRSMWHTALLQQVGQYSREP